VRLPTFLYLGPDKAGEWMRWNEGEFYWDFVTAPDPSDTTPPIVVSTWPQDGEQAASTTGFNPRSLLKIVKDRLARKEEARERTQEGMEQPDRRQDSSSTAG